MRIATWNVNSLKARLEKVEWWLERVQPDVVLMQETKLSDADVPTAAFQRLGYEVAHHGEGRWNGVAIASRVGASGVVVGFGDPRPEGAPADEDAKALGEARMISAVCGGVRVVSVYVPNGRKVDSPFYGAKLVWLDRLARWLREACGPSDDLVVGGDFNVAPTDADVWDPRACHGGTHVSVDERARIARLVEWGLVDGYRRFHDESERYTWWDYRAGDFYRNVGMRIDLLLLSASVASRLVASEIDREARKGKPIPSDHAPLVIDLDQPGRPFDAGWAGAEERIAQRKAAVARKAKS